MMFISKTDEQKLELVQALIRNTALHEKCSTLEKECETLANRIISSQLSRAEEEESSIVLRKELNSLKRSEHQQTNALAIARNQIASMSSIVDESNLSMSLNSYKEKSVEELLELKDEMIKCLQDELVEVRLSTAESDALIRDLKATEEDLRKDNASLSCVQPSTIVADLQEELLVTKMREAEDAQEFARIKEQLGEMRRGIDECLNNDMRKGDVAKKSDGVVILPNKLALWKSNKVNEDKLAEVETYKVKVKKLTIEAASLQSKVNDLEVQNRMLVNQMCFNEEEKVRLYRQLQKKQIEEEMLLDKIAEKKVQAVNFQKEFNDKMLQVSLNKSQKKRMIKEYGKYAEELLLQVVDNESDSLKLQAKGLSHQNKIFEVETMELLEKKIMELQTEINRLKDLENVFQG